MLHGAPYDPRKIANLLLEEAGRLNLEITNLALQKLLYFAHGFSLVQHQIPLVSGYFEAWQLGPVHPTVYDAFKLAKGSPIRFMAEGCDPLTGKPCKLPEIGDPGARRLILKVLLGYGEISPSRLVNITHAKKGPWASIVEKSTHSIVFGMRIPNDIIVERFGNHLIPVANAPHTGESREDAPFN